MPCVLYLTTATFVSFLIPTGIESRPAIFFPLSQANFYAPREPAQTCDKKNLSSRKKSG
jgi:hypothetical protein